MFTSTMIEFTSRLIPSKKVYEVAAGLSYLDLSEIIFSNIIYKLIQSEPNSLVVGQNHG